jgi:hypothetical protein
VTAHVATHGKKKNDYTILIRKNVGKRLFQKQKYVWNYNIEVYFGEIGCGMDSSDLGQSPWVICYGHGNKSSG